MLQRSRHCSLLGVFLSLICCNKLGRTVLGVVLMGYLLSASTFAAKVCSLYRKRHRLKVLVHVIFFMLNATD